MTVTPHRPAAVARRQLLVDRFAELLEAWGSPHAEDRARQLRDVVDDLGFVLPAAIADAPPPRGPRADPEHQAACMAEIRAALTRRPGA